MKQHKHNSYYKHAMQEFKACGWLNEDNTFKDGMQEHMCDGVLDLLDAFADQGHSGSTAPYAIDLFEKLASFEPVTAITGEDWEWMDLGDDMLQNKRCGHVFKDAKRFNGQAYDTEGKVFYDIFRGTEGKEFKSHYTCSESCVPVVFPYTPTREYLKRPGT